MLVCIRGFPCALGQMEQYVIDVLRTHPADICE